MLTLQNVVALRGIPSEAQFVLPCGVRYRTMAGAGDGSSGGGRGGLRRHGHGDDARRLRAAARGTPVGARGPVRPQRAAP